MITIKVTNTVKLLTLATKAISSRKTKDMAMIMDSIVAIQGAWVRGWTDARIGGSDPELAMP